jgi:DNA-binding beta-propeller fold protein YncE
VGVSPDGTRVFVTGTSSEENRDPDFTTLAYDALTGSQRWVAHYDGPSDSAEHAVDLAVSPDGTKVFVTGDSFDITRDYATVAYDASTGAELWAERYVGPTNSGDQPFQLAVSPDSAMVFVTGYGLGPTSSTGSTSDYTTVAYEASTGTQTWLAQFDDPQNGDDQGRSIAVSPQGSFVYVTGVTRVLDPGLQDIVTIGYEAATGTELWLKRFNGPANDDDYPNAIGVSPDGSEIVVAGPSTGPHGGVDYATVAYEV